MLDIGRDKIPSMETLRGLIDLFAAMRINHLQMYMEGFSFDYEDFHYLFTNAHDSSGIPRTLPVCQGTFYRSRP